MSSATLRDTLLRHGVRPTVQRIAVYGYLLEHHTHPTADTVFEALRAEYPTFSRTTVYHSLYTLAEHGLARILTIENGEQRFDGNADEHGHFRCTVCGGIHDFDLPARSWSGDLPDGFFVQSTEVYLAGKCPHCAEGAQVS